MRREELVARSRELEGRLGCDGMSVMNLTGSGCIKSEGVRWRIDIVTALHACNTGTDEALR
ncbi:methyltransferase, partial [Paraburkholderia ginsengiterrae]|uniref:methyltransferase n=1 Tax=Paraburkholderia ginsengiterrae TaxID=1462993 RepID=UPI0031339CBF